MAALVDAVDDDALAHLAARFAARQHGHLVALGDERLRELGDVPRQAALDDRGVLPREEEDAGHRRRP